MSKILLYSSILLTLLASGLAYWNHSSYQLVLAEKFLTTQQQQQEIEKLNEELSSLKEKLSSTAVTEEQYQKNLSEAQQARIKAESDLAEAQKQLATKEEELAQRNKDLLDKEATIQSLKAASKNEVPAPASFPTTKKKSSKNAAVEKKDSPSLAPPPASGATSSLTTPAGGLEGQIAAVNPSWNFVVLNIGENNGLVKDSQMLVKRGTQTIATIKITSVEPLTSIGDIIPSSVAPGCAVQMGDQVSPLSLAEIKK